MRGHIRSRSPGSWTLQWREHGRIRVCTVRGSKRDTQRALREIVQRVESGTPGTASRMRLGVHLRNWLNSLHGRLAPTTYRNYEAVALRVISPALGHIELARLTAPDISQWLQGQLRRLAPSTVAMQHQVLRVALGQAVDWELLATNPAAKVRAPSRARSTQIRVLTPVEVLKLVRSTEHVWLRAAIVLAACCGLRRGEVCGLTWEDVDLDGGVLFIRRAAKTLQSQRPVGIPEQAVTFLRLVKQQAQSDFVCQREDGSAVHPDILTQLFHRLTHTVKLKGVTFHGLRHTYVSLMAASGVQTDLLSRMVGHSSAETTRVYLHALSGMEHGLAERFGAILSENGVNLMSFAGDEAEVQA